MARDSLRIAVRKFEPFERAIEKQFASFRIATSSSLELEVHALDLNPLRTTLFDEDGLRDGNWDVAFLCTDWIAEAVETKSIVDLRPFLDMQPVVGFPGGWSPALLRLQQSNGQVWGLPYHDGPQCLIYRKDLFEDERERQSFHERFGYWLSAPETWDQFSDVARFFTRPSEDLYGTIFAAYPDGHNAVYDFCVQLWSRSGDLIDGEGRPALATPEAEGALDFYRATLADRTMTPPGLEEIDSVRSGELFAAGRVAMMVNWFGFAAVCEQPGGPLKGRVAVGPPPRGERGSSIALNVYWILVIAAGSRHANEAYAFLRHVASPEMDKITALEGAIACRKSSWRDEQVNQLVPFFYRLEELHANTRELPSSPDFRRLSGVLDEAIRRAISSSVPSSTILADAQSAAAGIRL